MGRFCRYYDFRMIPTDDIINVSIDPHISLVGTTILAGANLERWARCWLARNVTS